MELTLSQMQDILLAAVAVELEKDGTGSSICSFTKQPGDSVALDYAECGGMAWVRLVDSRPTVGFTRADVTPASCYWGLTHTLEIGIMRPSPIPEESLAGAELPDDSEMSAATEAQMNDLAAMHRAIKAARREFELLPGTYTPVGPVGGTVGGTWAVQVGEE